LQRGRSFYYYRCLHKWQNGKEACPDSRNLNALEVEQRVWKFVSDLLQEPEQLREDLERMVERERQELRGDPDRKAKIWLQKISESSRMRSNYQEMAARGLITLDELGEKIAQLEEGRSMAECELEALKKSRERMEQLEQDKDALLESYTQMAPEMLHDLSPQERHQVYKMLRLEVTLYPDYEVEVTGAMGGGLAMCKAETLRS
jgi:hypothetical protein